VVVLGFRTSGSGRFSTFSGRESNASLTPGPSFAHNLGCRCANQECEGILDIYTSRPFQWYKEHVKARCFGLPNRLLSFRESRRTPNSHFREWEFDTPTLG
jgi:hypothetical protein